jgi:hypothetical protein
MSLQITSNYNYFNLALNANISQINTENDKHANFRNINEYDTLRVTQCDINRLINRNIF